MDKPASHHVRQPRLRRVPAEADDDFAPQITAQPRTLPDDIAAALADNDEDLSVAPEDLGVRFLSEAVEQGDFDPERATVREVSLFEQGEPELQAVRTEDVATVWDELAEAPATPARTEPERSQERQSGFAPAGTHAASQRQRPAQRVLRLAASTLRWVADILQPSAAKRR